MTTTLSPTFSYLTFSSPSPAYPQWPVLLEKLKRSLYFLVSVSPAGRKETPVKGIAEVACGVMLIFLLVDFHTHICLLAHAALLMLDAFI